MLEKWLSWYHDKIATLSKSQIHCENDMAVPECYICTGGQTFDKVKQEQAILFGLLARYQKDFNPSEMEIVEMAGTRRMEAVYKDIATPLGIPLMNIKALQEHFTVHRRFITPKEQEISKVLRLSPVNSQ